MHQYQQNLLTKFKRDRKVVVWITVTHIITKISLTRFLNRWLLVVSFTLGTTFLPTVALIVFQNAIWSDIMCHALVKLNNSHHLTITLTFPFRIFRSTSIVLQEGEQKKINVQLIILLPLN